MLDVKFTSELQNSFAQASHDFNPLHLDSEYAKRTPFGQCLVFGMAVALRALGEALEERRASLISFSGTFRRPVFLETAYQWKVTSEGDRFRIDLLKGAIVQSTFELQLNFETGGEKWKLGEPAVGERTRFLPATAAVQRLLDACRLQPGQIPFQQFCSLLWSSYFIGMECPGKQALFAAFSFQYAPGNVDAPFEVSELQIAKSSEFNQCSISGKGSGIAHFELEALERPRAVEVTPDDSLLNALPPTLLAGKNVLVTGAGRGFGSALALVFSRAGASLLLNVRREHDEVKALATHLQSAGAAAKIIEADISRPEECKRIAQTLGETGTRLDFLLLNAAPVFRPRFFLEQSPREFYDFVTSSLQAALNPCFELLPLMASGGTICLVSSIATQEQRKEFSHYAAAKIAQEATMRSLAVEFPAIRFAIARPGMMLTDQMNHPFSFEAPRSTISVAKDLLLRLMGDSSRHLVELNFT